ncbi:plasma membrane fusion protein [Physcia stellaris]|nr:plasma membrane fusion protein [Physcia stellaris]
MPASKPYSIYSGGYSEAKKAQLEATKIPEKLKCKVCKKLKPSDGFSERQRSDLKQRMAKNPALGAPSSAIIVCRQCTPGQTHELECFSCGLIKSLDGFTKAQRRHPDNARCILCVNADLEAPTAGNEDFGDCESGSDDDSSDGGVTNPYAETASNVGTTSHASLDHNMGNLRIEDNDSDDENPYATKSSAKRETTSTGYDARDTPYRQSQTSSAIGSSSTMAPRSNFARVKSDNVKNAGGTIFVTEAARSAIGRQRYRDDDSSDSEYGYM